MASFDKVIAISKTVEDYVNKNYQRHLKSPPKLIYRGSDKEYFSNNFNEFHSINLNNGSINWINDISSSLTPIIVNSLIFTISENGYLFVIDKKTGNIIKIKDVFKNYKDKDKKKIKPMGFSISQDKVYLTNSDGKLTIIELNTGDIAKVENISRSLISKPFLFNNNLFVIKNGGIVKYE